MTKEELKQEIEKIGTEISSIEYVSDDPERYNELYRRLNKLTEMHNVVSKPMVASSDELDIYVENKGFNGYIYHLTLHDDIKPIGYVRITYDDGKTMYGNIGYEIRLPYRGNNFALKALELLEDTMIDNGLTKPILIAHQTNLASIRIIEKFGGELIGNRTNGLTYNCYQVDLIKKKEKDIKQKSKHL